jgi:hypothetical protein
LEERPRTPHGRRAGIPETIKTAEPGAYFPPSADTQSTTGAQAKPAQQSERSEHTPPRRVVIPREQGMPPQHTSPVHQPKPHKALHHDAPASGTRVQEPAREADIHHINDSHIRTKDTERQRIEKDLQRQRMIAISGQKPKTNTGILKKPVTSPGRIVMHQDSSEASPRTPVQDHNRPAPPLEKPPEQKTVIIGKRKPATIKDQNIDAEDQTVKKPMDREELSVSPGSDAYEPEAVSDGMKVNIKDPSYRAKDGVFGGKSVVRTAVPSARDSGLVHTRLTPKKSTTDSKDESEMHNDQATEQSQSSDKKQKGNTKKDDISWI